jgi:hypothetical protein
MESRRRRIRRTATRGCAATRDRDLAESTTPVSQWVTQQQVDHMHEFKFDLGDEVRDTITNYCGVIVARTQWLTNCNTYMVKSRELKDGQPRDAITFDEPSVELVKPLAVRGVEGVKTGGPTPAISQTNRY